MPKYQVIASGIVFQGVPHKRGSIVEMDAASGASYARTNQVKRLDEPKAEAPARAGKGGAGKGGPAPADGE